MAPHSMLLLPTHVLGMVSFALLVSITFAFLSKNTVKERFTYALWAFVKFLLVAIGIGWLLFPFSR